MVYSKLPPGRTAVIATQSTCTIAGEEVFDTVWRLHFSSD